MFFSALSLLFFILLLSACDQPDYVHATWHEFYCRDRGNPAEREVLYRAKVPKHWIRKDCQESVADSMKPICTFIFGNPEDPVELTIHTFTVDTFEQRIPPAAQVNRWKRQFDEIDLTTLFIEPRAHGGFTGLKMTAFGKIKEKESGIIAYSMQLAPPHWMSLQQDSEINLKQKEMTSDYTLKAFGSPFAISQTKEEIETFANSFELIDEIPLR